MSSTSVMWKQIQRNDYKRKRKKEMTTIQSGCGNDCKDGMNQVQRNTGEGEASSEWERTCADQLKELASGQTCER